MMEIKELRCFGCVAETLSFKRAAERLNMSQSVVTKTIAQLEHRLGAKLFERTTRRVALTSAGVVLRREVGDLLEHFDRVQRQVRHAIGTRSGRFAIGVVPLAMQTMFPQIIRQFREAHPDIMVDVQELATETQVKALLSAELDAAFLLAPVSHPELEVRVVQEERMRLAIPIDHPHLAHLVNCAIPLAAFAGETFIIPPRSRNPGVYDEIIRNCAIAGFRPRVQDCHESDSCLGLVEAGLGVSFIAGQMECGSRPGIRVIDLEQPAPVLAVAVCWRRDDPSTFLETLRRLTIRETIGD